MSRGTLHERRRLLIEKSDAARGEIDREFRTLTGDFAGTGSIFRTAWFLRATAPKLAAGLTVATLLIGPRRISGWVLGARKVLQTVQGILAAKSG